MQYSETKHGRVFVIRLQDGENINKTLEAFVVKENVTAAHFQIHGAVDKGSIIVVGPQEGRAADIVPIEIELDNVFEIQGVGTIFPNKDNQPVMHLHLSCGRENLTYTGCAQKGMIVWHVAEVILMELMDCSAKRLPDVTTKFNLLTP